ncbi:MAG: hypothetical protein OXE78_09785 [Gammaproteobacteria bacterium]|nr:hypothetical protein [Gammaproteobacteria bacterium]MCY4357915.1 hypothetical protein [Gammaproteobacteria bacterium]
MDRSKIMHYLPWALAIFIAIVFVQSLFFKFTNSFETQHIFGTIGEWMAGIGFLEFAAPGFAAYGGYTVGSVELIASMLLLARKTQALGAVIAFAVISGAIFFHLFTPLGVSVIINEAGDQDGGQLFTMAVLVWMFSIVIMYLRRSDILAVIGNIPVYTAREAR